jgi:hypothetical protein
VRGLAIAYFIVSTEKQLDVQVSLSDEVKAYLV